MIPRFVIAGTSSGVGKTTVAVGLMAALRRRGLRVQPFKVGPDYIDPTYHLAATGVPSRNLDSWMVPEGALLELFERACRGADVAVVEGVMGLFDGFRGLGEEGSTAQVAKRLGAPVLLVLNVSKMARSAAAMAFGYARFDPDLQVMGFLLNNVGSESHFRWAREAIDAAGVGPVLGYLPSDPRLKLPERHLGLVPTPERALPEEYLDRLVEYVESRVDVGAVLARIGGTRGNSGELGGTQGVSGGLGGPRGVSRGLWGSRGVSGTQDSGPGTQDPGPRTQDSGLFPPSPILPRVAIAVARDEAFNFYYEDNLDLLEAHGARLLPFSPLRDHEVPAEADALYLGGGFPELFAPQLAGNWPMLDSVRRAVESGMPVYAECGGLMYLCREIVDDEGAGHPMVGVVPGRCSMKGKRLHLGYVEVESLRDSVLGPAGTRTRGHEFHWSLWDGLDPAAGAYRVLNQGDRPEGFARGNLIASFVHLHFGSNPSLAPVFVQSAEAHGRR